MSEQKWGEAGERERAREREELLAKLAPELRAGGERLLEACEQGGLGTTAYIAAMASLASTLRAAKRGEASEQELLDLLKETLAFYRAACIAENSQFMLEEILSETSDVQELRASLAYGYQVSASKMKLLGARVKLLLEGLPRKTS